MQILYAKLLESYDNKIVKVYHAWNVMMLRIRQESQSLRKQN
jgi:hypothetical protein